MLHSWQLYCYLGVNVKFSITLYHSGLAPSIFSAEQLISHKQVAVNDKVVSISNCQVRPDDIVKIRETAVKISAVIEAAEKQNAKLRIIKKQTDGALSEIFKGASAF